MHVGPQQQHQHQQQEHQQHQSTRTTVSRRRRRAKSEASFGQLLPVAAAAVALCGSTSAFVPTGVRPSHFSQHQRSAPPLSATPAETGRARRSTMVLGESPSTACRRALQRAWQASSSEATAHERLEQHQQLQHRDKTSAAARAAAAAARAHDANESSSSGSRTASSIQEEHRGLDFRLTTFNLLAPCYKRMHLSPSAAGPSGDSPVWAPETGSAAAAVAGLLLATRAKPHHTARESEFNDVWRERALETVDFIRRDMASSDIICLQEFWLGDPSYDSIFRAALGADYDFHTLRRTGGKADGLAVLLRRGRFDVRSKLGLSLSPVGDRVALVMHLRARPEAADAAISGGAAAAAAAGGEDMVLVNTHLAFPHNALDRVNQMSQIEVVTQTVESVIRESGLPTMTPRLVVGDLNVEEADPVCRHLGMSGFHSAFSSLHQERRVITHRNHRGEEVMVDHVFVKAPGFAHRRRSGDSVSRSTSATASPPEVAGIVPRLHEDVSVEEALLLPERVDTAEWSPHFSLSDHRPLTVRLRFPAE